MVEIATPVNLFPTPVSESQTGEILVPQIPQIDVPRNRRGGVRWALLRDDPKLVQAVIETEAGRFIETGGTLSSPILKALGMHNLMDGIFHYYPGRMIALQEKLGVTSTRHTNHFWEDSEVIRSQCLEIYQTTGTLSIPHLERMGRYDLRHAVNLHYPGRWPQLLLDLNLEPNKKPDGYWTTARIQEQAQVFYQEQGRLNARLLLSNGHSDLANAILGQYPGGWKQLKQDIGIEPGRQEKGYWTNEVIEAEALKFLNQYGKLTHELLWEHKANTLAVYISRRYPGGIRGLREKLGLENTDKPQGYWTPERIEEEARSFIESHGMLTYGVLIKISPTFYSYISTKYPGGIAALREKLGITETDQIGISADDANAQLQKLLEEQV